MPQGIGYPSTTLAGPNGQPAIDAATNAPLTIEMLLARRGLMGYGGNHNLQQMMARQNSMGQQSSGGSGTVDDSGRVVTRSGGTGPAAMDGAVAMPNAAPAALDPSAALGLSPEEQEELQEASMLDMLMPVGAGASAGAGYYLARRLRAINQRRSTQGMEIIPETSIGTLMQLSNNSSAGGQMLLPSNTNELPMIGQKQRLMLGGPDVIAGQAPETQKALTDRKAPAKGRASRAAAGQPNDMDTIPLRQRNPGSMEPYAVVDALRDRGMPMRGNTRGPAGPVTGERMDGIERSTSRRIPRIRP